MKRTVDVPAVAATEVFFRVRAFPPVLRPSIVTLSAPLRSISGAARAPVMVRSAPPAGWMEIEV